jgi:two-component system sensor kinase FixL
MAQFIAVKWRYEVNHILVEYDFRNFGITMTGLVNTEEKVPLLGTKRANRPNVDAYIKPEVIFEFAGQGILLTRADGEIVKINHVAERMFGYDKDELLNRRTELLIQDGADPAYILLRREFLYPAKTRALGTGFELMALRKDDSVFPIEVGVSMVDTPAGKFAMIIIIDISQRREQEDQLKKAHLNLQYYARELQASNFELENFAYVSSHDLLEPLRKISAFGTRLKIAETDNLSVQGREYLDRILHASDRMESLINDLLTFSRLSTRSQPFVPVDLNVILTGVISDLEVNIEKTKTRIEAGSLPVIEAEPTQMRQLFQNLIANAIKFRKENEAAVIKITSAKNVTDPGREVYDISFADNGIGFDEKYKDKVFNIFQTLAGRKYEGSGIGLAICRKIAIRHGGNITVKSAVNIGSVFVVSLSAKQISLSQK